MNLKGRPFPRVLLAAVLASLTALGSGAAAAAPPGGDAVTERVREILRKAGGDSEWGADPPAAEIAERGEPSRASTAFAWRRSGPGICLRAKPAATPAPMRRPTS